MQETGKTQFDLALKRATERTSIAPIISDIQHGTWAPIIPIETLYQTYINPSDPTVNDLIGFRTSHEVWNTAKADRNALITQWITEMWTLSRAYRESPQQDLVDAPYMVKKRYTQAVLDTSLHALDTMRTSRLQRDPSTWNALDQAYHYYRTLIAFGTRHYMTQGDTAPSFISRGVGTDSNLTWGLISLAHRFSDANGLSTDPTSLIPIIEHSYKTISPFIHMHKEISATIINLLYEDIQHDELNPDYFHFVPYGDSYIITLNRAMVYSVKVDGGLPALEHVPASITTGCPASYVKDTDDPEIPIRRQKTIIRRYFEWSMALAFPQHYS